MTEIIPVKPNYLFPFNETNHSKCKIGLVCAHGLFWLRVNYLDDQPAPISEFPVLCNVAMTE